MKNYWSVEWVLCYDGRLYLWRQIAPSARRRIRRLVGKGRSMGRLTARDIL